jgi:DNA-directed RNA polymerase delta subunit
MFEPSESEFADAKAIFSQLVEVVRSHFGYEERELEEAIGLFLDAI